MSAEIETFPRDYVEKLRSEAAGYRTELNTAKAALSFYINKYPLGDLDNFHVTRVAMAQAMSGGKMWGPAFEKWAKWELSYMEQKAKQGDQISGQDGGFLAPETWNSQWFDVLRPFTVFDRLPIKRVSVPAKLHHLPKITNDVTISYPGENTSTTATVYKFGQVTYNAHKAMAQINLSNELIRDSAGLADEIFRSSSAEAIASDRDNQLLNGQGGPNPTGLLVLASDGTGGGGTSGTVAKYYPGSSATTDISTTPAHGTPSFLHVSSLRSKVTNLNGSTSVSAGQARCSGIIAHSRFERTVHTIAAAAGAWTDAQGRPLWMGGLNEDGSPNANGEQSGASLMGLEWALTNLLTTSSTDGGGTTSSFMIAGYWQRYVLFECLELDYLGSPLASDSSTTGFAADQTEIRVIHRYDGGPAQPEAFAVLAGCDQ